MTANSSPPYRKVATQACAAPFVWHYQREDDPKNVLCGEVRRRWEPVSDFAKPSVFEPCEACVCHCGQPVYSHPDGFTRGLCRECDSTRCDVSPGPCGNAPQEPS